MAKQRRSFSVEQKLRIIQEDDQRHTYPDNTLKHLTFYHNDAQEFPAFDNLNVPAYSLSQLQNLRGNLPQFMARLGGSSFQQATMNTVANITNWSSITSIIAFVTNTGDQGITPWKNVNFSQDFMANNRGLQQIATDFYTAHANGLVDTTFKISRLKSDWNTYFTELNYLAINEDHWTHEDLSSLKKLSFFMLSARTQDHTNSQTNNHLVSLTTGVIDSVFNQIASGAGAAGVRNGQLYMYTGGATRTANSDTAFNLLTSLGWTIAINTQSY